ncbi:hypothetical protein [Craterilacuibacter sp. RT1T]|uniref:hypothetical protein n=1 Tax=Craterilacuibacter sp. RT1T TaxID=2942211 RepID=UPI0020BE7501|nr:hypothetical protein [Craterilacuibacter sp. RT1T]MCL6263440.1 hypothetical protein [Craterilacuibacter sp. RT1T]
MKSILILLLACCLTLPAYAGPPRNKDKGAEVQGSHRLRELRLRQALKNGDISPQEANQLRQARKAQHKERQNERQNERRQGMEKREKWQKGSQQEFWREQRRQSQRGADDD